jgi:hypothetical protein
VYCYRRYLVCPNGFSVVVAVAVTVAAAVAVVGGGLVPVIEFADKIVATVVELESARTTSTVATSPVACCANLVHCGGDSTTSSVDLSIPVTAEVSNCRITDRVNLTLLKRGIDSPSYMERYYEGTGSQIGEEQETFARFMLRSTSDLERRNRRCARLWKDI